MTRTLAALLLAAAALAPVHAVAQTAAAAVDPERRALGYDLAKLLNPEAQTLAMIDRMLTDQLPQAMMADESFRQVEQQYPGIVKAMVEAMRPIMMRHMREELPSLWSELAVLYASELSADDLRAGIAFYRSPAGQRIIELMASETDVGPMLTEMVTSGEFEVTADQMQTVSMSRAGKAISLLTPDQREAANRFVSSPAGRRVVALSPRAVEISARWGNRPTPELDAELEAVAVKVVEQFTGMKIEP